jgi:hypothetical protein
VLVTVGVRWTASTLPEKRQGHDDGDATHDAPLTLLAEGEGYQTGRVDVARNRCNGERATPFCLAACRCSRRGLQRSSPTPRPARPAPLGRGSRCHRRCCWSGQFRSSWPRRRRPNLSPAKAPPRQRLHDVVCQAQFPTLEGATRCVPDGTDPTPSRECVSQKKSTARTSSLLVS